MSIVFPKSQLVLSYANNKVSYKVSPITTHIVKHLSRAKSADYSNKNAPIS